MSNYIIKESLFLFSLFFFFFQKIMIKLSCTLFSLLFCWFPKGKFFFYFLGMCLFTSPTTYLSKRKEEKKIMLIFIRMLVYHGFRFVFCFHILYACTFLSHYLYSTVLPLKISSSLFNMTIYWCRITDFFSLFSFYLIHRSSATQKPQFEALNTLYFVTNVPLTKEILGESAWFLSDGTFLIY